MPYRDGGAYVVEAQEVDDDVPVPPNISTAIEESHQFSDGGRAGGFEILLSPPSTKVPNPPLVGATWTESERVEPATSRIAMQQSWESSSARDSDTQSVAALQHELKGVRRAAEEAERDVSLALAEAMKYERQVAKLKATVKQYANETSALRGDVEESEMRYTALLDEVGSLRAQLDDAHRRLERAAGEAAERDVQLDDVARMRRMALEKAEEVESLREEVAAIKYEHSYLSETAADKVAAYEDLARRAHSESQLSREKIAELEDAVMVARGDAEQARRESLDLEAELNATKRNLDTAWEKVETLEKALKDERSMTASLREELECTVAKAHMAKAKEARAHEATVLHLERMNLQLKEELRQTQKESDTLRGHATETSNLAQRSIDSLREDLQASSAQIAEKDKKCKELGRALQDCRAEVVSLTKELEKAVAEKDRVVEEKEAAARTFHEKLSDMNQKMASTSRVLLDMREEVEASKLDRERQEAAMAVASSRVEELLQKVDQQSRALKAKSDEGKLVAAECMKKEAQASQAVHLQEKCDSLRVQVEAAELARAKAELQCKELEERCRSLADRASAAQQKADGTEQELGKALLALQGLQADLVAKARETADLKEENSALQAQVQKADEAPRLAVAAKEAELEVVLRDLEKSRRGQREAEALLAERGEELRQQRDEAARHLATCNGKMESLKQQLTTALRDAREARDERDTVIKEVAAVRAEVAGLRRNALATQNAMEMTKEADEAALHAQLHRLKADLANRDTEVTSLRTELTEAFDKLREKAKEVDMCRTAVIEAEAAAHREKQEALRAMSEMSAAKEEHSHQEEVIHRLRLDVTAAREAAEREARRANKLEYQLLQDSPRSESTQIYRRGSTTPHWLPPPIAMTPKECLATDGDSGSPPLSPVTLMHVSPPRQEPDLLSCCSSPAPTSPYHDTTRTCVL